MSIISHPGYEVPKLVLDAASPPSWSAMLAGSFRGGELRTIKEPTDSSLSRSSI